MTEKYTPHGIYMYKAKPVCTNNIYIWYGKHTPHRLLLEAW